MPTTTAQRDFLTGERTGQAYMDQLILNAIENMNASMSLHRQAMEHFANAVDREHPVIPCTTNPPSGTTIEGPRLVEFVVGVKKVRVFWLLIQNNTANTINFKLNEPTGSAGFTLAKGQYYESWRVGARAIGLYVPTASVLNASGGIILQGLTTTIEAQ